MRARAPVAVAVSILIFVNLPLQVALALVALGADASLKNVDGLDPEHLAAQYGHVEIAAVLAPVARFFRRYWILRMCLLLGAGRAEFRQRRGVLARYAELSAAVAASPSAEGRAGAAQAGVYDSGERGAGHRGGANHASCAPSTSEGIAWHAGASGPLLLRSNSCPANILEDKSSAAAWQRDSEIEGSATGDVLVASAAGHGRGRAPPGGDAGDALHTFTAIGGWATPGSPGALSATDAIAVGPGSPRDGKPAGIHTHADDVLQCAQTILKLADMPAAIQRVVLMYL